MLSLLRIVILSVISMKSMGEISKIFIIRRPSCRKGAHKQRRHKTVAKVARCTPGVQFRMKHIGGEWYIDLVMARKRKSPSSPTPTGHLVALARHIRKRKNIIDCKEHIPKPTNKWDFYIPASTSFPTMKWNSSTNVSIVDKLREYLPAKKFKKFQKCCFGHFVNLPSLVVQHQVIRCLMVRELYHDDPKEFHVEVKGSRLRFSLQEFGVITGLRCCGSVEVPSSSQPNRLMEKYFPGCTTQVSKEALVDCVTNKRWESGGDDDFKLCILYFIHSFLYSSMNRAHIKRSDFDLVESGDYENFPWGIELFDETVGSLRDQLRTKKQSHRLAGFPLAVQIWFYECCSTVDTTIVFVLGTCILVYCVGGHHLARSMKT